MESDEDVSAFNSWPAFTDIMLAVILILILVIGGLHIFLLLGVDIQTVRQWQQELADGMRGRDVDVRSDKAGVEIVSVEGQRVLMRLMTDTQNPMLQRISFSERVLFAPDSITLVEGGKQALRQFGEAIRQQSGHIVEIQIHGHADVQQTNRYTDNLELASQRANEVFRFLRGIKAIDPVGLIVTAKSYG